MKISPKYYHKSVYSQLPGEMFTQIDYFGSFICIISVYVLAVFFSQFFKHICFIAAYARADIFYKSAYFLHLYT